MALESVVPHFSNPEAGKVAMRAKNAFQPVSLYPRDGTEELIELEGRLTQLTRMNACEVLAFGSGMEAIREAVELVDLTAGDKAVFGKSLYSQSTRYQEKLRRRGVTVLNPGIEDTGDFVRVVQENKPKLVYAETVTNTPQSHVLDIEQLLDVPLAEDWDPLIILDPTMATPSQRPLADLLDSTDKRALAVESGTKNYRLNTGLLGLAYSKWAPLLDALQIWRRTGGTIPDVSVTRDTLKVLPSQEVFDERNLNILRNNKSFAEILHHGLRLDSPFLVGHPNLPNHPHHVYASRHYPIGASQCLFITDRRPGQENGEALLEALWEVRPDQVKLGQSFGFDATRLWFNESSPAVRVSCGAKNAEALKSLAAMWAKKLNGL